MQHHIQVDSLRMRYKNKQYANLSAGDIRETNGFKSFVQSQLTV